MNCTIRIPVAGVAEYYIEDASDEVDAKERALNLARQDARVYGRRFEIEAVTMLTDASYQEIEVDDIEEDEDEDAEEDEKDDPEVK